MTKTTISEEEIAAFHVREVTSIDPILIRDEYIKLPGHLAHWNAQLASANERYLTAKHTFEKTEAQTRQSVRDRLEKHPTKTRITEGMVDELVLLSDDYDMARSLLIKAETDMMNVQGICRAIMAKKDMLVSLGAHVRAELHGDPATRTMLGDIHGRRTNNG